MVWYKEELKSSNFLSLLEGKHEVKVLGDPTFRDDVFKDSNGENKEVIKADFLVEYKGEKLVWSLRKGGDKSVYGKLVLLARANNGLINKTIIVRASGEKLKRQYWIELKGGDPSQ